MWLRICLAGVVVVALVLISDPWGEPDDGLVGRNSSDRGFATGGKKRCSAKRAERIARAWFRGMGSVEPAAVGKVTSSGDAFLRYVITIRGGEGNETLRLPSRASVIKEVPGLTAAVGPGRSFEVRSVGVPPMAAEMRKTTTGRLAGADFKARVGKQKWQGKVGLRCEDETAYFAAFAISDT